MEDDSGARLGEEELADEEGQDEGQQEEQEVGPEGEDAMMRSIDGEEGSGAEAGSNTMAADESPDVISSYTEAQAQGEGSQADAAGQTDDTLMEEREARPASAHAEAEGDADGADAAAERAEGEELGTADAAEGEAAVEAEAEAGVSAAVGELADEAGGDEEQGEVEAEGEERAKAEEGEEGEEAEEGEEGEDVGAADSGGEQLEELGSLAEQQEAAEGEAGPGPASALHGRERTPEHSYSAQEADAAAQPAEAADAAGHAAVPAHEAMPLQEATTSAAASAAHPRTEQGRYNAIDVEVNQGPGLPFKMISVLLDYSELQSKPYLGGYKNKKSGAVYHHAWTQTPKAPKYQNAERKNERQTQTVKVAQRTIQTVREAATQMERPGIIIDTSEDREITPGRYQTSEERLEIVTRAVCTIQRYLRGYLGRKRAAYLREKKQEREAFLREQEIKAKQEAEEHRRREIERRMHPKTASDFEILYNELEAWRLQETRKIKQAGLAPEKEQEVLQQLLHKETKLLQTIDRLKINANHENKDLRIQHTLTSMGKPKKFELKNGKTVEVHTPFTTRAMELMQLYNGLNLPMLTIDERLDVLLHVKWTVKEFDCNLTREIVDLIDREADLLNRGRNPRVLEGLRKRISSLFLTFIETPEFNPESARFQIVPMEFETYLFEKLGKAYARAENVGTGTAGKWSG